MKAVLLGALAYALVTFPLAYVWHLVAFAGTYDELNAFTRTQPVVPLGFAAIVLQGVLLSAAYPLVPHTGKPARDGLRFGLAAGLLLWSSQVLEFAAKHEVTSLAGWFGIETAYFAVQFALVGIALGLIHHRRGDPAFAASVSG
jgi:hypothetical protein